MEKKVIDDPQLYDLVLRGYCEIIHLIWTKYCVEYTQVSLKIPFSITGLKLQQIERKGWRGFYSRQNDITLWNPGFLYH